MAGRRRRDRRRRQLVFGTGLEATETIDVTDRVVAPGFIDVLADNSANPAATYPIFEKYKVADGVSTALQMHGGSADCAAYYAEFGARPHLINYGGVHRGDDGARPRGQPQGAAADRRTEPRQRRARRVPQSRIPARPPPRHSPVPSARSATASVRASSSSPPAGRKGLRRASDPGRGLGAPRTLQFPRE